jgi:hypothetical protein
MDILDLDPSTFPRDDFGPPLGGMAMDDYERWNAEMLKPHRTRIEDNPPPQPDGEPFIWRDTA